MVERVLQPARRLCPACGRSMRIRYDNRRTVATLAGPVRLRLKVRRCQRAAAPASASPTARRRRADRPAAARVRPGRDRPGRAPAPRASTAACRRSTDWRARGRRCQRTVTNLLDRYDECWPPAGRRRRLREAVAEQGRVILAIDGLQPDVGHEVLWVLRDCLTGEVLLARSLLSGRPRTWPSCCARWTAAVAVPVAGVVSDGQHSIRKAVAAGPAGRAASALPLPLPAGGGAADLRGGPARQEGTEEAGARRAADRAGGGGARRTRRPRWCAATAARSAARSPTTAARRWRRRAEAARAAWRRSPASLERVRQKGGCRRSSTRLADLIDRALASTAALWPESRGLRLGAPGRAILGERAGEAAARVRRRFGGLLAAMRRHRDGPAGWPGRSATSSR